MKTLTIRLEKFDLAKINVLQNARHGTTINGTIRKALDLAITYINLKEHLSDIFISTWAIDQKKLKELNARFGILQGRFDW